MDGKGRDTKGYSLKRFCGRIIFWVSVLAMASAAAVIWESFSSARRYTENISRYTLQLYVNTLDELLHTLQTAGRNFLNDHTSISVLAASEWPAERYFARQEISSKLSEVLKLLPEAGGMLFWTGSETVTQVNTTPFEEVLQIEEYVLEEIAEEGEGSLTPNSRWSWHEIQGEPYLLSVVNVGDAYCAMWIEKEILTDLAGQRPAQEGQQFDLYCRSDQEVISSVQKVRQERGLILEQQSREGDFALCMSTDSYDAHTVRTVYLIILVCVFIIGGFCLLLRRLYTEIAQAVSRLTDGVEQVGKDLRVRLDDQNNLQEVNQVFQALNTMAERIQLLQTEIYKRKIQEQKLQIQFLEMQIKSHFYVNCLNIIYSMAATKKYGLIQEFTLYLVDFYRYIESAFAYMTSLTDEMTHISSYIEIQRIRYPERITYRTVIDTELGSAKIPPLILLTFVENIFKHAMSMSEPLHILISANRKREDGDIRITIEDDGKGFPENLMRNLNEFSQKALDADSYPGKRTGIMNTICRLSMYYGNKVRITFEPGDGGRGSRITMQFPEKGGGDSV